MINQTFGSLKRLFYFSVSFINSFFKLEPLDVYEDPTEPINGVGDEGPPSPMGPPTNGAGNENLPIDGVGDVQGPPINGTEDENLWIDGVGEEGPPINGAGDGNLPIAGVRDDGLPINGAGDEGPLIDRVANEENR